MDKVPEGPGLIVFYHGAFPLDYYYFVSRLYLRTGRFCCTVVDYHFSKIPGKTYCLCTNTVLQLFNTDIITISFKKLHSSSKMQAYLAS